MRPFATRFLLPAVAAGAILAAIGLILYGARVRRVTESEGALLARLEQRVRNGTASPEDCVRLGELYLGRGETLRAAEMGFRARKAAPGFPAAHNLLGVIYASLGEDDKARSAFERALVFGPDLVPPRMNLARLELRRGDPRRALEHLQRAVELQPNEAGLWLLIGQAQRAYGSHVAANASFRRALQLDPNLIAAHVQLGIMHLDFDRPSQAVPEFENAYRLGDRDPVTLSYFALALLTGTATPEDVSRAEALLAEAGHPDNPPSWFAQGLLAQRKRDWPTARDRFLRILKSDPNHERAQFALAETYRAMGDVARAEAAMRRHHRIVTQRQRLITLADRVKTEGPRPELLRRYVEALLEANRVREAEDQLRAWIARSPTDPKPRRWLERLRRGGRSAALPSEGAPFALP